MNGTELMSEGGAEIARLRELFDAATVAVQGWGQLPEGQRTEKLYLELRSVQRAADVELASAERRDRLRLRPERPLEDLVREAGGTVV